MVATTTNTVPVTVLTGYLGAGKTTLLNRILTYEHGKKVAVIVNEFGEVGIDNQLVIDADEEIFEMNNGCICCTVRGDLIRIIGNLMKRRHQFDHLVIETTGLADPAPVIQTFFVDEDMKDKIALDAVVTVVDAKHIQQHWEADEAQEQIAFADVILLNKTDLVSPQELDELESKIKAMNGMAKIYRTQNSELEYGSPHPWMMRGFPGKISNLTWSQRRSSNAPLLAASSVEGIAVWKKEVDDEDGWDALVLTSHERKVQALLFHPQSLLLASAADDGYLCLWTKAKQVGQILEGTRDGFSCLAWSKDGTQLAAGGQDGELIVWSESKRGKGFG